MSEASLEAVHDLRSLKGGYLGPVVIHAMDRHGSTCVVSTGSVVRGLDYFFWGGGTGDVEMRRAELAGPEIRPKEQQ